MLPWARRRKAGAALSVAATRGLLHMRYTARSRARFAATFRELTLFGLGTENLGVGGSVPPGLPPRGRTCPGTCARRPSQRKSRCTTGHVRTLVIAYTPLRGDVRRDDSVRDGLPRRVLSEVTREGAPELRTP